MTLKNIIFFSLFALCVCSCKHTNDSKPTVTVSIPPQKYLLEKIVGDKYDVTCLLEQSSNPETFEPGMSTLMNVERSDAYFRIGNIGFEDAIIDKIHSNNPNLPIFNSSEGINLIEGSHGGHSHHDHDGEECHHHDIDPHVWSSTLNAIIVARNMCDGMAEIDPDNADFYRNNLTTLENEINELNKEITAILLPLRGKSFLVWHPSLSYFARDYGLNQITIGSEGKESSIRMMKTKIDMARRDSVPVFLYQPEFDSRQVETLNREIGAKMVSINPMNYNWDAEMLKTAKAIADIQ